MKDCFFSFVLYAGLKSTAECDHEKKMPLVGYIHETTKLKQSRNNYSYFNFKFQAHYGLCEGVCFEKSLYKQILQKEEMQKSVRLTNYSLKRSLQNSDQSVIVVNKRTKIENSPECSFEHVSPPVIFKKIQEIKELPDFSLVTFLAKAHIFTEVTEVNVQDRMLKKVEGKAGDETGAIKMTVWEKMIDVVKEGGTYQFSNARVRSFGGDKYISVGIDSVVSESSIRVSAVDNLMEEERLFPEKTVFASKIIGVQDIQRYALCRVCRKKLGELESDICVCEICGLNQLVAPSDKKHVSVGICVDSDANVLKLMQDEFQILIKYFNKDKDASSSLDLSDCRDSDIIRALLSLRNIKLVYNTKTKVVRSVSSAM